MWVERQGPDRGRSIMAACLVVAAATAISARPAFGAGPASSGPRRATSPDGSGVIGPGLVYLGALRDGAPASLRRSNAAIQAREATLLVSIRFAAPPTAGALGLLQQHGVEFVPGSRGLLHTATVYPAHAGWDAIAYAAGVSGVIAIEPAWRAHHERPLDVSRGEVQAEVAWTLSDRANRRVTGEGVTIADFDTGVDLYHPLFWRADGDTLSWLDVNANGQFDPGVDAVDLNGNRIRDPGETLGVIEAPVFGGISSDPTRYNPRMDWLYRDVNGNGRRDAGPASGFTEGDPTFGEPVYIALDRNGNDRLDPRERIVALGTCKVKAIHESTGAVRRRGVDLIASEGDTYGHGTQVAGILAGGTPGQSRFAGIAPGAELLMGNNVYVSEPPFIVSLETLIPWARDEGADVMLYEDGEWVWNYLDGSSNVETMMNEMAAEGIAQVVPTGNLAIGRLHMSRHLAAGGADEAVLSEPEWPDELTEIWPTILWRGDLADLAVTLEAPDGTRLPLDGSGDFEPLGGSEVYSYRSRSPRGTCRMDLQIVPGPDGGSLAGNWRFLLASGAGHDIDVHGYSWDNLSGWIGFGYWAWPAEDANTTVTWPATCDSAITVGAYQVHGIPTLSDYSGRGPRIDGRPIVDLTAPGNVIYSAAPREIAGDIGGYGAFGGTSAAGPHVAAGIALFRQRFPDMSLAEITRRLFTAAGSDRFTGAVPNETWGYGRVRILNAFAPYSGFTPETSGAPAPLVPASPAAGDGTIAISVSPNPSGAGIAIGYTLPRPGPARVEIYDIRGRRVAMSSDTDGASTDRRLEVPRALPGGMRLGAGTYLVRVTQGGASATSKVVLLP